MLRGRQPERGPAVTSAFIGAAAAGAFLGAAVLIAIMPWTVSFGIAASTATTWCLWIEHHPENLSPRDRDRGPEKIR